MHAAPDIASFEFIDEKGGGLHEVYYDDDGAPQTMMAAPMGFRANDDESPGGILHDLRTALDDASRYEVLEEREFPAAQKETPPGL